MTAAIITAAMLKELEIETIAAGVAMMDHQGITVDLSSQGAVLVDTTNGTKLDAGTIEGMFAAGVRLARELGENDTKPASVR